MKSFFNETQIFDFSLQKVLSLLYFRSCQNCMSSTNLNLVCDKIQFWKNSKCRRDRTFWREKSMFHWWKISCFVFISIFPCMWPLWPSKNRIFFHTDIFPNCIPSSVYVCVFIYFTIQTARQDRKCYLYDGVHNMQPTVCRQKRDTIQY